MDRAKGFSPLRNGDRRELCAIADRAFTMAEQGLLVLVQKRHGPGQYSYYAIKTKRPSQQRAVAAQARSASIPAIPDEVTR